MGNDKDTLHSSPFNIVCVLIALRLHSEFWASSIGQSINQSINHSFVRSRVHRVRFNLFVHLAVDVFSLALRALFDALRGGKYGLQLGW